MAYQVLYAPRAVREVGRLPKQVVPRILDAALALSTNPRPPGCKKLRGVPSALVLCVLLLFPGCLLRVERLPPDPVDEIPSITERAVPGQGGVLAWHSRDGSSTDAEGAILSRLRATGVFTDVRSIPLSHGFWLDYDPEVHGPVDWILSLDREWYEGEDCHSVFPIGTIITFGLVPDVFSADGWCRYQLERVTPSARDCWTVTVPSSRGDVRGLISGLALSLLPDWQYVDVEEERDRRQSIRACMEILRIVLAAPPR